MGVDREAEGRLAGVAVFPGPGECTGGVRECIGRVADLRRPPEPGGVHWSRRWRSHLGPEIHALFHRPVCGFRCGLSFHEVSQWWTGKLTPKQSNQNECFQKLFSLFSKNKNHF